MGVPKWWNFYIQEVLLIERWQSGNQPQMAYYQALVSALPCLANNFSHDLQEVADDMFYQTYRLSTTPPYHNAPKWENCWMLGHTQ